MRLTTRTSRSAFAVAMLAVLCMTSSAFAQPLPPRIGYVYPAGGKQGTTVDVTIAGQYFEDVSKAFVSGSGVKATVIQRERPITQKEAGELRAKVNELQKKRPLDAETKKQIDEIRKKLSDFVARSQTPALADLVTLQIKIDADAAPGIRDLRIQTPLGLSNPLVFCVGQLPEVVKPLSKIVENAQQARAIRNGEPPKDRSSGPAMKLTLPAVANGQIMPGGVDRYRFAATKGQRLVFAAATRELIPYIADAVPGWFQGSLTLYDADGRELEHADHFRFYQDPVMFYEAPKDGEYILEIHDSIYRGREDFVYRLTVGDLPYVTGIFPLGCRAGSQTAVELVGWNLPSSKLTQDAQDKLPGVYPLCLQKKDGTSNSLPFAVDSLGEVLEKKPNGSAEAAQAITLPVVVNGRVEKAGQWSVYRFDGREGDEIVAEVVARRLGSPLDSLLKLTDAAGKQVALNDDKEDKAAALDTHHADSYIHCKLPAGGTYYLWLGDAQRQAGPEYAYRLRVSAPRPDFELRIVPSSISIRGGGSTAVTVFALRKDGFAGEIELSLKGAPGGFSLEGGRIPAGMDKVRVTLSAPMSAADGDPVALAIEGKATSGGLTVVKRAAPADDREQAFAYHHLVPAQELLAAVSDKWATFRSPQVSGTPLKIAPGKTAKVQVSLPPAISGANYRLDLVEPPEGVSLQGTTPTRNGVELLFRCDAAKAKPGLKGNLIVNISSGPRNQAGAAARTATTAPATQPASTSTTVPSTGPTSRPTTAPATTPTTAPTTAPAKPPAGGGQGRRASLGTLPAIMFEVVAPPPEAATKPAATTRPAATTSGT